MASFARGEYITAEKLNLVNKERCSHHDISRGDVSKSISLYLHSGSSITLKWERFAGVMTNICLKYRISKFENGHWIEKDYDEAVGSWPADQWSYDVSRFGGEGWYSIWIWAGKGSVDTDGPYVEMWVNAISDKNVRGDWLRYYDNPQNSGNPISIGDPLTAEDLNTGRVMTINHI